MKKLLIIMIPLLWLTPIYALEKETAILKKCVDGDTAVFIIDNNETRVRFLAIDTPESVHPTKEVEAYAKNASEYTCKKLTGAKKIEIEYEDKNKLDKYGRTLGWIFVDDSLLQEELIKIGYAKVKYIYGKYKYTEKLYEIEEEAKKAKLGVWADKVPNTYTVTFINDDEEIKVKVNENEKVEELIVNKEGYTFKGWYNKEKKFDFTTKITNDITLEAKYTKNYNFIDILILLLIIIILYIINPKKTKKKLKKLIK